MIAAGEGVGNRSHSVTISAHEDALTVVDLTHGGSACVDVEEHAACWQYFAEALLHNLHAILRGWPRVAEEQVESRWVGQRLADYSSTACSVLESLQLGVVLDLEANLDDHQQGGDKE